MRLQYTDRFLRAYDALGDADANRVDRAIRRLAIDPHHPSLHTKKIRGTRDIWEARASISLRPTFETHSDLIILRNVGQHDEALKRP